MPPVEVMDRRQQAVYWAKTGITQYSEPLIAAPVELDVRWVTSIKQVLTSEGNTIGTDIDLVTDRELVQGSILWEGKLVDLPTTPTSLFEVVTTDKAKDIKGRVTGYGAALKAFKGTLPTAGA